MAAAAAEVAAGHDLSALFPLPFEDADAAWLRALDDDTLQRAARRLGPPDGAQRLRALNLGVAFRLAFKVALRSRGIVLRERRDIHAAIGRRLWRAPLTFVWPPRDAAPAQ